MELSKVVCPVCHILLADNATHCPDCGQDLSALVHLAYRADILYNRALADAKEGNLDRAIRQLEDAFDIERNNLPVLNLLGKVQSQVGMYENARASWQRVLELAPENLDAATGLKWLAEREQQSEQAITHQRQEQERQNRKRGILQIAIGLMAGCVLLVMAQFALNRYTVQSSYQVDIRATAADVVAEVTKTAAPVASSTVLPTALPSPTVMPTAKPTIAPTLVLALTPTVRPTPMPTSLPDLATAVKHSINVNPVLNSIPITIEQKGLTVNLIGVIPSLRLRYLFETTVASVEGVSAVNTRRLALSNTYIVQPGEGVWDVAAKVYGSPLFWRTIAKANDLQAPYFLRIGQVLILPEL